MWKTALILITSLLLISLLAVAFEPALPSASRDTLILLIGICATTALFCFVVSTVVTNYSQVDKLWSIMPIVYTWVTCYSMGFEPRLLLMAILVSLWGIRLTANFARRGGYRWPFWQGEEDYRWSEVRKRPEFSPTWAWPVFNLLFISFYQMFLILLFTLPIVKAANGTALGFADTALGMIFTALVLIQCRADNQQWAFQQRKYQLLKDGQTLPEPYSDGFIQTGLWALARHPNYSCEQAIWIVFYLFSVAASGQWLNWSVIGCLLLLVLFRSSSQLSEDLSSAKYPLYADYQKRVPRFVPKFVISLGARQAN